jgi:hypothetical protein
MLVNNYYLCIVREATEVVKHPGNINREDKYSLSKIWSGLHRTQSFSTIPESTSYWLAFESEQ